MVRLLRTRRAPFLLMTACVGLADGSGSSESDDHSDSLLRGVNSQLWDALVRERYPSLVT